MNTHPKIGDHVEVEMPVFGPRVGVVTALLYGRPAVDVQFDDNAWSGTATVPLEEVTPVQPDRFTAR